MNITKLKQPIKKAVVYLEPEEFRSTWLGNKAVYRTRMAMKTGGELIILAPGVNKFGEDKENKCYKLLNFTDKKGDVADPYWTGNFNATLFDIELGLNGLYEFLEKE